MKPIILLLACFIMAPTGMRDGYAQETKKPVMAGASAARQARNDTVTIHESDQGALEKTASVRPDSTHRAQVKADDDSTMKAEADSAAAADPLNYARPVYTYDSGGRRDPFNSLVPKENKDEKKIKTLFNYEKAVLRGIVQTDSTRFALLVDMDNYAHVLRVNDRVLNGYVTDITDDTVYLHIVQYGRPMRIILRMETARQTVRTGEPGLDLLKRPGINLSYVPGEYSGAELTIDDVVVPSVEIRTIEDEWFGPEPIITSVADEMGGATLIGPREASEVIFPQLFRWTKSAGDSLYTIVFSKDDQFRSQLVVKEGITGTSYLFENNPGLETGKRYFWKVVALKRSGKWIHARNPLSFVITDTIVRGTADEKR